MPFCSKDAPVEPKKEEKKEEKTEETEEAERTEEWPGIEEWQSLHLQKTAYGSESISVLQRSYRIYVGDFHSFEDEEFALVLRARLGVVDDGEDVKGWRHVVRLPVPDPWSQNTFSWQARQVINRAAVEAARLRAEYKVKKTKRFLEPLIGPPTEHACSIDLFDFVIRARSKPRKKWYMEREQWALFRRECADAAKEQRPLKPGICVAEEDLIVRKIGEEDPRIELRNQDGLFAGRVLLPGEIIPYKMYVMLEHQLKPEDEDLFNLYGFDLDTILLKKPRTHGKKQSKKKTEENAKEDCYALCGTAMLPFGNKSGKINDWRLEITEESAHAKATPQCLELQNCRFFVTLYEMEPMVHLQMIKRVEKHEELLTDYGTPYWLNWLAARKSEQIKKKRKKRKNEEEKEKNDENEEPRLMMMMECPNCGCRVVAPAKYCPAGCQFRRQCLGCHALLAAPPHDKCCSMCGLAVVVKA